MKNGLDRTLLRVCGFKNKAVFSKRCTGKPPLNLDFLQKIVMVSTKWVTESFSREQEWPTDTNVTLKEDDILEALNHEIDVPCLSQCGLLRFSAPTDLNLHFMNNGTKIEKFFGDSRVWW